MKTTLLDLRLSRFPEVIGACFDNVPRIAAAANEVVQRLIVDPKQPETGWFGTWVPMVFQITRTNPFITAPRGIARIMLMDVCRKPIKIQNSFYEYLLDTKGLLPVSLCASGVNGVCVGNMFTQGIHRGWFPTLADVPIDNPQYIRVYPSNPLDVSKRILIQAYDGNGLKIYSLSGSQQIEGEYLTLDYPFTDSNFLVGPLGIYGIQKDYTYGDLPMFAVDSITGVQTALARYEPGERNPWYPRYYLDSLPQFCCDGQASIQINAIAKRDYYPVAVDQDWLLIGNIPALISEAASVYQDNIQEASGQLMSQAKHQDAIRFLQGELDHQMGKEKPAINVSLFGSARLEKQSVGTMI